MGAEKEALTNEELYGREILEAISYSGDFPVRKKKLLANFEKIITECSGFLDENELNEYKKAKGFIQNLPENELENVCIAIYDLYHDTEDYL